MIKNLLLVLITFLVVLIGLKVLEFILGKVIFPIIEFFSKSIAKYLTDKFKMKYWIIILEILFILQSILMFVYFFNQLLNDGFHSMGFSVLIFGFSTFTISSVIYEIRQLDDFQYSVFSMLVNNINKEKYFISRIKLFLKQLSTLFILIAPIVYSFSLAPLLEFNDKGLFLLFLVIPLSLTFWVYSALDDFDSMNMRRIIVYLILVVLIFQSSYTEYKKIIYSDSDPSSEIMNLFLYLTLAIYIALDRLLKAIVDDYKGYKEHKQKQV